MAKRFLFLEYETSLGTAVTSCAVYEALRKAVPDASIAVACSGIPGEILKYNPHINEILPTPHPATQWIQTLATLLAKVRKRRQTCDCVVLDAGNRRVRYSMLAILSGVRHRVGFRFPGALHHFSLSYDLGRSLLANNLRLISLFGHPAETAEPAVYFSKLEVRQVEDFCCEQQIRDDRPLVAIQTQTSGGEPNQWYDDRFAEVAQRLCQMWDPQLVFVGTANERQAIDAIRRRIHGFACSAAGRTDIPTLAALLCRCDLLLTLDTGTMHVGRAVGVPMVIIAPAKNPAHEWLPLRNARYRIIRRPDGPCPKCGQYYCSSRDCMDQISVGQVMDAINRHLAQFPPSATARRQRTLQRLV